MGTGWGLMKRPALSPEPSPRSSAEATPLFTDESPEGGTSKGTVRVGKRGRQTSSRTVMAVRMLGRLCLSLPGYLGTFWGHRRI